MTELEEIVLSVVVPVYNQAESIARNVRVISESVATGIDGPTEVIVVSDGSIDETAERALQSSDERTRVIHYDRNLGKGYAVKLGALEARGRWIAYVDADLDLDPAWLPGYVRRAEAASLDFAIGSKRHPDSVVSYPDSRRVASWLFQRVVRALFRIDVRDTQVGMKVFRREVAEEVLPLLLVKRFAFDIELLAVARALGYGRIEEQPIRLDYKFTGSGVRSVAVLRALIDTAAIFYRLRILRYYQRKQRLGGRFGWTRPREYTPLVSVLTTDPESVNELDYPRLEAVHMNGGLADALSRCRGDVVAVLESGARPAGNWITATTPFLRRPEIAAVVVPQVAPQGGSTMQRVAAAVRESRLGGGSLYFRHTPGNVRYLRTFHGRSYVGRRESLLALDQTTPDEVVDELTKEGGLILYTPESVLTQTPPPFLSPHVRAVWEHAVHRGKTLRRFGLLGVGVLSSARVSILVVLVLGAVPALSLGGTLETAWLLVAVAYVTAVLLSALVAAIRFRSFIVGALAAPGLVLTNAVHLTGVAYGFVRSSPTQ